MTTRSLLYRIVESEIKRGVEDFEPYKIAEAVKRYYMSLPSKFRPPDDYMMFREMEKACYYASLVADCDIKDIFSKVRSHNVANSRYYVAWYCIEVLMMKKGAVEKYLGKSPGWIRDNYNKFLNLPEHDEYKKLFKRFKKLIEEDPDL